MLETSNDVGATEELYTNKLNEFMQSINDGFTVDEVEIDRTYIEMDQIMKRTEDQKCMLEESVIYDFWSLNGIMLDSIWLTEES